MMRSLYSAVSGLKTHQTRMDVIGNNIANVNTETDLFHRYRLYLYLFRPVFLSQKAPMRMIFQESF